MNIRTAILLIALLLAAPLFGRESTDVIVMKNGDHITCEIKGLSGGVLSVWPPYVIQTISVDWSKVARLESKQLFIVKAEDGSVYRGTLNTAETPAGDPMKVQVRETPGKKCCSTARGSLMWVRLQTSSWTDSPAAQTLA